jgi:hypothetical protein
MATRATRRRSIRLGRPAFRRPRSRRDSAGGRRKHQRSSRAVTPRARRRRATLPSRRGPPGTSSRSGLSRHARRLPKPRDSTDRAALQIRSGRCWAKGALEGGAPGPALPRRGPASGAPRRRRRLPELPSPQGPRGGCSTTGRPFVRATPLPRPSPESADPHGPKRGVDPTGHPGSTRRTRLREARPDPRAGPDSPNPRKRPESRSRCRSNPIRRRNPAPRSIPPRRPYPAMPMRRREFLLGSFQAA